MYKALTIFRHYEGPLEFVFTDTEERKLYYAWLDGNQNNESRRYYVSQLPPGRRRQELTTILEDQVDWSEVRY